MRSAQHQMRRGNLTTTIAGRAEHGMLMEAHEVGLAVEARMVKCFSGRYVLVCLVLSFSLSASPAQQSLPEGPTPNPETVIHSTVRLVQVSVVVEDKKGNPVTDLKPEDFTVLDEGKPQKDRFFYRRRPTSRDTGVGAAFLEACPPAACERVHQSLRSEGTRYARSGYGGAL